MIRFKMSICYIPKDHSAISQELRIVAEILGSQKWGQIGVFL